MNLQNVTYYRHAVILFCVVLVGLINQDLFAQKIDTSLPPEKGDFGDSIPPEILYHPVLRTSEYKLIFPLIGGTAALPITYFSAYLCPQSGEEVIFPNNCKMENPEDAPTPIDIIRLPALMRIEYGDNTLSYSIDTITRSIIIAFETGILQSGGIGGSIINPSFPPLQQPNILWFTFPNFQDSTPISIPYFFERKAITLSPGTLLTPNPVDYDGIPGIILGNEMPLGGTGLHTYQWQTYDSKGIVQDIPGATNFTYQPPALQRNTYFRRRVVSGTEVAYTLWVEIKVKPSPGTITPLIDTINCTTAICISGNVVEEGGNGYYTYRWKKFDGAQTSLHGEYIPGATSASYCPSGNNATTLLNTTSFQREVTSGGITTSTPWIKITLKEQPLNTGYILPENAIVIDKGTTPPALQVVGVSGGNCNYAYQWYKKIKSSGQETLIIGATSEIYQPSALNEETLYSCQIQSGTKTVVTQWKAIEFKGPDSLDYYTSSINYIVSCAPTEAVQNLHDLSLDLQRQSSKIVYHDGLGYPIQTVLPNHTSDGNTLVSMLSYDAYKREHKQYLPYPKNNNGQFVNPSTVLSDLETFYGDNGLRAFSETVYESSSLNRVTEKIAPGAAWQNHPVRFEYLTNTEPITTWEIPDDNSFVSSLSNFVGLTYQPNQLYIVQVVDENDNLKREYKDKLGNLVMTEQLNDTVWLQTRYVYNYLNLLVAVVPPQADDVDDESLCYYYRYDYRGRLVEKKIPGADWVYLVYDSDDRLIYTQDGNQRSAQQWVRYTYDNLGRELSRQLCVSNTPYSRETMQNNGNALLLVRRDTLSTTWYDIYPDRPNDLTFKPNDLVSNHVSKNKNRVTMQKTVIFDENFASSNVGYLTTAYYYDKYGREIQAATQNHLGGVDRVSTSYDFRGNILQTLQISSWTNSEEETDSISLHQRFEYDALKRPTAVLLSINGGNEVAISETEYDELVRLKNKTLHNGLETISYDYNIRNWLTQINSELFIQELFYEKTPVGSSVAPQYNGNISATSWKTQLQSDFHSYAFSYDGVDRLVTSEFYDGDSWSDQYTETLIYDKNGNIKSLQRKLGADATSHGNTCLYNHVGNQTTSIRRVGGGIGDLPDITSHFYDANGNLVEDPQTIIDYNLLNLPQQITLSGDRTITNTYTAGGQKIQTLVREGNETLPTGTKYYNGNLVFNMNRELDYILFSEGRIVNNEGDFAFEYHLRDHLGSTRVAFTPSCGGGQGEVEVVQINNYYPFGAPIADLSWSASDNKYFREGKEYIDDFDWNKYDFHARTFDPFGGRSLQIDPKAEFYYHISPYALWGNNPIRNVDPNGMDWYSYEEEEEYKDDDGETQTRTVTKYKYVEGTLSDKEVKDGGYTHLGQTHETDDTYYSLGGGIYKYNRNHVGSLIILSEIMKADYLVMAKVNASHIANDFWSKYKEFIGTGSDIANILRDFMDLSKDFKGTIGWGGRIFAGINAIGDIQLLLDGDLRGMKITDAIINIVSTLGTPGAAISLGYTTAKKGATWIQQLEMELRQQADRLLYQHFRMW